MSLLTALPEFAAFVGVLTLGLVVGVPAYARLLRRIEAEHPEEFERLGRPSLRMASPSKSLALQRFIYVESRAPAISARVSRLCRFVGVFTPLYVVLVLFLMARLVAAGLAVL